MKKLRITIEIETTDRYYDSVVEGLIEEILETNLSPSASLSKTDCVIDNKAVDITSVKIDLERK